MQRIGLVVHPSRDISAPLDAVRAWARDRELDVVQVAARGSEREDVAPPGEVDGCDVVIAIGGDGTVLTALRAAATSAAPVLGVACGTLGALSEVAADAVTAALDRMGDGEWTRRELPSLVVSGAGGEVDFALNDLAVVRRGGQVSVDISVDGELYVRVAGDGVVVATALGSSAYSMASGGPVLLPRSDTFVVTPLAHHGGNAPALVVPPDAEVELDVDPGYGGFAFEVDGHEVELAEERLRVTSTTGRATLVGLGGAEIGVGGLRRRGLLADSPRVLARDARDG